LLSKILGIHQDSSSQNGSSLGSVKVHSLTFSYILKGMRCDSQASLLARTFTSPCLSYEPKARVTTLWFSYQKWKLLTWLENNWYWLDIGCVICNGRAQTHLINLHSIIEIYMPKNGFFVKEIKYKWQGKKLHITLHFN